VNGLVLQWYPTIAPLTIAWCAVAEPEIPIPDDDEALLAECRVDTFRAGGKGGQHQNTTESGVRLVHRPSGLRVESRTERSQHRNRQRALARLRDKLEALNRRDEPRVPTRVPPAEKRRRLEAKRRRARLKDSRRPPDPTD
jgi:protein subunit release factor A